MHQVHEKDEDFKITSVIDSWTYSSNGYGFRGSVTQSHLDTGLLLVGVVAICPEWIEMSARQKAPIDQLVACASAYVTVAL